MVIQRAFRRHSAAKAAEKQILVYSHLPKLPGPVRGKLQQEIASYRDTHPPPSYTRDRALELHQEAQREYEKFLFNRAPHARHDDEIHQLISKLNRNCELMLGAPSLQDSAKMEGVVDTYSSRSSEVAKMARTAHREELRAMATPWWKRAPLAQEELNL